MVIFSTLELSRGRFGHASAHSVMMHYGLLMHEGRGLLMHEGRELLMHEGRGLLMHEGRGLLMHEGRGLLMHEGRGLLMHEGRGLLMHEGTGLQDGPSPLFFTSRLILRCMRTVSVCTSVDSYCILLVD